MNLVHHAHTCPHLSLSAATYLPSGVQQARGTYEGREGDGGRHEGHEIKTHEAASWPIQRGRDGLEANASIPGYFLGMKINRNIYPNLRIEEERFEK